MLLAGAPAMAAAAYLAVAVGHGLPLGDAARAVAVVLATQVIPGTVVWRLTRPPSRGWWFEDVVMGSAIGVAVAVAAQVLAGSLRQPWIALLLGPLIAVVLLAVPAGRARVTAARTDPLPALWYPLVAAASLVLLSPTWSFLRSAPLVWQDGFRRHAVDLPFHLSLAGQLAHRGPIETPFLVGEPLGYHWFSHAWIAQISVAGDVPLDAVLLRFMPALMPVAAVFAVAIAAVRITGRVWTGPLAALIAAAAVDLSLLGGQLVRYLVNPLSPSLSLSILMGTAVIVVLACRWRDPAPRGSAILLAIVALATAGMKGSALPVVVGGAVVAIAATWWRDGAVPRRMALDIGVLLASLGVAVVAVFRGVSDRLDLDPGAVAATYRTAELGDSNGALPMAAAVLLLVVIAVTVLARGAGMVGLFGSAPNWRDPLVWLLAGTGLSAAAAMVLLHHPRLSQLYFVRNAAPALAIGSAWGLVAAAPALGGRFRFIALCGVVVGLLATLLTWALFGDRGVGDVSEVITAAGFFVAVVGVGSVAVAAAARGPKPALAALTAAAVAICTACVIPVVRDQLTGLEAASGSVAPETPRSFSADQMRAARWLRDHSQVDDIVMTNRHCATPRPARCESRRFHVAAYTERRVLVEGWAYNKTWTAQPPVAPDAAFKPFWDRELLELNDRFLTAPTAGDAQRLQDLGVRWIFIDKTEAYDEEIAALAAPRLRTRWAWVLELVPSI